MTPLLPRSTANNSPHSTSRLHSNVLHARQYEPIHFLFVILLCVLIILQCYHLYSDGITIPNRTLTSPIGDFQLPLEQSALSSHSLHQLHSDPPTPPSCDCPAKANSAPTPETSVQCPPVQVTRRQSLAVSHPPSIAPLFPAVYYVYDLQASNSAILMNFSIAFPGKYPFSFEYEDFRHASEYSLMQDVSRIAKMQQQYLCMPPSIPVLPQWARSRFTHDPRLATHFIIPTLLTMAKRSRPTDTDDLLEQLVQELSKPIRVVDPCNPQAAIVEVPSPFLTRHGVDHLLLISGSDIPEIMGTRKRKWEPSVTAAQIARARMFEDCTFFNVEARFVNQLRLDFMNFFKNTDKPYDTNAHMSQKIVVPYSSHFLIESSLDPSAMWIDETIAERKHLFFPADSPSVHPSVHPSDAALLSAYTFLSTIVSKDEKKWNDKERQFNNDLPTRPFLFTLTCTVFDKGHETRVELFKMLEQKPLNKFKSNMKRLTGKIKHTLQEEEAYLQSMLQSDFCFVPVGTTPSSSQLYDAILTNCIPVIISDKFEFPYSSIVNWSSFTVRISQSTILSGDATPLIELSQWSNARKHSYRLALMRVRQHFDWNGAQKEFTQDVNQRAVADIIAKPIQQVYGNLYHKEYRNIPQLHRFAATDMMLLQHQADVIGTERWNQRQQKKVANEN